MSESRSNHTQTATHTAVETSDGNHADTEEEENLHLRSTGSPPFPALLNFLKGMFGAGILAIPGAFKHTGVVLGFFMYSLVGAACGVAMVALVYVKHELQRRNRECNWLEQHHQKRIARTKRQRSLSDSGLRESRRLGETEQLLSEAEKTQRQKRESDATNGINLWQHRDHQGSSDDFKQHRRGSGTEINAKERRSSLPRESSYRDSDSEYSDKANRAHSSDDIALTVEQTTQGSIDHSHEIQTYAEVGEAAMGRVGRFLVETHVVVLEWAFCAGFVFVGYRNLQSAYRLSPVEVEPPSKLTVGLISTPFLILLSWIKQLKDLWFISLCGLVVYVVGVMGVTFYEGFVELANEEISRVTEDITPLSMIQFTATAVYSLEGINLVLPIESSLKDQRKAAGVIGGGTAAYALLCATFGAFGYFVGFGTCEDSRIVTDCLKGDEAVVVSVTLVVALFFTHALTLFPATEIVERKLFDPSDNSTGTTWWCRLIRAVEVLLTVIVGLMVDSFEKFSGLIGALMMSTVGFILPALFVWSAFHGNDAWPWCLITNLYRRIKHRSKNRSEDGIALRTYAISRNYENEDNFGSILTRDPKQTAELGSNGGAVLQGDNNHRNTERESINDSHYKGRASLGDVSVADSSMRERSNSMFSVRSGRIRPLKKDRTLGFWGSCACIGAIIFGVFIMVFGIYSSLQDL